MSLYKNKYRQESARLPGWDYANPGYYFITICTHDRKNLFGRIDNGVMISNDYGKIVEEQWRITGEKNDNVRLNEFVVMPNHMHGILQIIHRITRDPMPSLTRSGVGVGFGRDVARNVPTETETTGQINQTMAAISPAPGSLAVIIRSLKSAITKQVNQTRNTPGAAVLQPRFHDHVVRNQEELTRIRQYIRNNPANWVSDKFNVPNNNSVRENQFEYKQENWMI